MKISARNQFAGKIISVVEGAVSSAVIIDVDGVHIYGTISKAAVEDLKLEVGGEAIAIIKATEVMIALGDFIISARNKFSGKITSVTEGAVNSVVTLSFGQDKVITSIISNNAVKELGLEEGKEAVAVVKATSVMFGVK